jgi:high-affinity Fe2+/Pb2+ permease
MAVALAIFGVAFAAFCVWLSVRIFNRREQWATRTAILLIYSLVMYVSSWGPATAYMIRGSLPDKNQIEWAYMPLNLALAHSPAMIRDVADLYLELWI